MRENTGGRRETGKANAPGTPKRHRTSLSAATGEVLTRFARQRPSDLGRAKYNPSRREMGDGNCRFQIEDFRLRISFASIFNLKSSIFNRCSRLPSPFSPPRLTFGLPPTEPLHAAHFARLGDCRG